MKPRKVLHLRRWEGLMLQGQKLEFSQLRESWYWPKYVGVRSFYMPL